MIVEALEIPQGARQTFEHEGSTIVVANYVHLDRYLKALDEVLDNPTTVMVYTNAKDIGTLFGGSRVYPGEAITDGFIEGFKPKSFAAQIRAGTYVGWVGTKRWEEIPSDHFITTLFNTPNLRKFARQSLTEITRLSFLVNPYGGGGNFTTTKPISWPFR